MPLWLIGMLALGALGGIALVAVAVASFMVYESHADELVPPDQLAINEPSYGAKIYDRNGKLLYEYVDDRTGLRRPIPLQDIAPAFLAATVATEDSSFFTNPGVNFRGLLRAAWENTPLGGEAFEGSGGSSITQQLVKNVYIPPEARRERWSAEGIDRKIKEMVYAIELTENYSKEKILEWYVNQISYGGLYNGVEAASQGYFGKPSKDLTLAEAALLAGIPQCPSCYDPVNNREAAIERRNEILDLMYRTGQIQIGEDRYFQITPAQLEAAKREDIVISEKRFPIEAPHWVLQYIEPQLEALYGREALFTDGLEVTTTLDLDLQKETEAIMERWITEFEAQSNSHNGAMMVMDPHTGEILVMLGSRDYFREDIDGKNNNATACNSPGSSFKPFAYITTFEHLGWGPGTVILDTPVTYTDANGNSFTPSNPSKNFSGPVTIRYALGNSLNIPANKAADAVGSQSIVVEARRLGFVDAFRIDGCSSGGYGPAIATGGVDVTLEEMMYGYSVLASGGLMRGQEMVVPHDSDERQMDPVSILKIVDAKGQVRWDIEEKRKEARVIDAAYPYLIWNILSDPSAQCATFGCGGITIPGYPNAGVKTGTSEPYAEGHPCAGKIGETWSFGFSPDLVVGIWAGNSDNSCVTDIVSTSIAFRAMRDTFTTIHANIEAHGFPRPDNVVEAEVCVPSGLKPTEFCGKKTKDLFVEDNLPEKEDTWWQEVEIDSRNGLRAGPETPLQFIERKVMLVLPEELLKTDEDKERAKEWAKALGVELAPTEVSDETNGGGASGEGGIPGNLPAAITYPVRDQPLSGLVQVNGRAVSEDFELYRLEYGAGTDPEEWRLIVERRTPVIAGTLGHWDTSDLEEGPYTLRLVIVDEERGELTFEVVVERVN